MVVEQIRRFQTRVTLGKETTWKTVVPTTDTLPVTDISESPQADVIVKQGLRGIGARDFDSIQGVRWAEFSLGGNVYPDQIGHLMLAMIGAVQKTGSGPYVHAMNMGNSPPSYTIEVDTGTGANLTLRYAGSRISSLGFNFEAESGALQFSSDWVSVAPTLATASAPAQPVFEEPFAGWRAVVTSTNNLTTILLSAEFTWSRELQRIYTGAATQAPYYINVGPLALEGRLVLTAETYDDYTTWLNHVDDTFTLTFSYGAAAAENTILLTCTALNLGNGAFVIDRSGVGVTFELSVLGIYNTTDVGPADMTLTNSIMAGY
jgi:hypothetical protein